MSTLEEDFDLYRNWEPTDRKMSEMSRVCIPEDRRGQYLEVERQIMLSKGIYEACDEEKVLFIDDHGRKIYGYHSDGRPVYDYQRVFIRGRLPNRPDRTPTPPPSSESGAGLIICLLFMIFLVTAFPGGGLLF